MAIRNARKLVSALVCAILGCVSPLVSAQAAPQSDDGHVPAATSSRLLVVTVPENGIVAYSEHHEPEPLQPVNILGQTLLNGSKSLTEKQLNRLNAEQTPIIAKSIADYDFKNKIVDAAKAMASENSWLGIAQITVNSEAEPESTAGAFLNNDFQSLLHLACTYHFPLEFDALVVHCYLVSQFRDGTQAQSTSGPPNSRLANRVFDVYVPLENSYSAKAYQNAARWSDRNAALARQALDMADAKLPYVLNAALASDPVPPGTPIKVKRIGHYSGAVANKDAAGTLVTLGGTIWSFEFQRGVGK